MIKVILFQKNMNSEGDSKRVFKSEKEIKKNKNYSIFINELSKTFHIQKNKFILMVLTHDEDEYPINNQEDLDSYLEEAKNFMIILEDNESGNKINKNVRYIFTRRYKKEEDTEDNMHISDQEIKEIMDKIKMPEIDNINDDIEFDINKYKNELNENFKKKFEDFKQVFGSDIGNIVSQKGNILKTNINNFISDTQKDLKKNLESIKEVESTIKKEFDKIIKENNEKDKKIKDLNKKLNPSETQNMIKFEKEEIKLLLSIKKANYFNIDNIVISNIGNRTFTNLLFEIDTDRSSKDLLFYESNSNNTQHTLSLDGPFSTGKNLNNTITFYIKYPKIKEYTIYIYLKEAQDEDGDIFSTPLKITVKLIEDPRDKRQIKRRELSQKKEEIKIPKESQVEIKKPKERQMEIKKPKERIVEIKKPKERQIEFQKPKERKVKFEKTKEIQAEQQGNEIVFINNDNENIDYKGFNKEYVNNMLNDLENEFSISLKLNKEQAICKIIEFNCDRDKMVKWMTSDSY